VRVDRDRLARLATVGPLAVILVSFATLFVATVSPAASRATGDTDLSDYQHILIEPADKVVFGAWLAITVLLLAWAMRGRDERAPFATMRALAAVLGSFAILVAALSVIVDADVIGPRPALDGADVVVGGLVVGATLVVVRLRTPWRAVVSIALFALLTLLAVPELWQTTSSIRDWDSSRFVLDEIVAPAVGRVPYGDFAPQYSALLGLPLKPVLAFASQSALPVVLGWMVAMQAIALVTAVALVVRAAGTRYLAVVSAVIIAPCIGTTPRGFSPTTYFASIPVRVLLPVLTIAMAYTVMRRPIRHWMIASTGIGLVAGAAALNNPDFGGPVLVAVLVVAALLREPLPMRLARVGAVALGAVGVAIAYATWAWASGAPVSTDYTLVFQRVFGATGYFNIAMPAVGLHVAVVSLFISAAVIGLVLVRRCPSTTWLGRQGLLLGLVGTWSLLSMGYYVGRSLTATLVGGYALQIGMVSASFVPLIVAAWRAPRAGRRPPLAVASVVLGILALVWCAGNLARVWAPWTYLGVSPSSTAAAILDAQVEDVRAASGPSTTQLLTLPAMTSLMSGVASQQVVSSPDYVVLSRTIAGLQCQQWYRSSAEHVVVNQVVSEALRRSPDCERLLDLSNPRPFGTSSDWVVIDVRR
jgi:hypothetical protein